ncbi:MAG: hypothetical protein PHU24_10815 [Sphaerochaetaceae bacterium]|nr:hypothetical protein [Sphaerochaetaceae bacterium]NLO60520.1 hypothetical protein [Spirochaetales bacterium]MDD4258228.1 hypothetical protein [Sphaerochaetaceae bacterium]MDD4763243.1 hypothetical protein [Sphaerochaetaceae bacterium]MDD4841532.1 hypothetical protein [Sphaerochaetaceae bacterium]
MRRIIIVFLLVVNGVLWANSVYRPTDNEVNVAVQGIVVAAVATMGAQNLQPPLYFTESRFYSESFFSYMSLAMNKADVGSLIQTYLASPPPPPASDLYFVDILKKSLSPFSSDYHEYVNFLQRQKVKTGEIIYTGKMDGTLMVSAYPFYYEGTATFEVSGSRFAEPFILDFSFTIPMEGPSASLLVPKTLYANGYDYIHIAHSIFMIKQGS